MDRPSFSNQASAKALSTSERTRLLWIKQGVWIAIIGFSIVAIYAFIHGRTLREERVVLYTVAISLLSLAMMARHPQLAAWLVLGTVWWELTLAVFHTGSFIEAALLVYPILVSAAGLLVGSRGSLMLAMISVVGVTAAGFLGGATVQRLAMNNGQEGFWLFVSVICMLASAVLTRAALKSYQAALADSERERLRYRALFEHLPEGLIGVDPHGLILEVNDAAARLLNLSQPELTGRPVAGVFARVGLGSDFDQNRARGRLQMIDLTVEGRDGGPVFLEISVQATRVPEEPTLLMLHDITQRKLIEQHLGHAQRLEAVGQLAGGIAHDFNNLLTAIGGSAEIITMDGDRNSQEMARLILSAQRRGSNLTRQLLAFARRDVHQPETVDLAATVAGMSAIVERLLGRQHKLQMARLDPVWIEADAAQIEQVVLNLVTNACDAMPGGGSVSIAVHQIASAEAGALGSKLGGKSQALLEVTDTGTGIAPELQARIFEPFFTTKPRGKGTGLGLAAVQGIVAQNQGCLALASTVGAGSRFRIFFLAQASPSAKKSAEALGQPAAPSPGRGRVLVVDDEDVVRETAANLLRHGGYDVAVAENGQTALELLGRASEPFVLALTDLAMPVMNGREFGERIRILYPNLRVLYMSGYFNDPGVSHTVLTSEAGFLPKPFSGEQLLAAVKTACES